MSSADRLTIAFERFDAANRADPNQELFDGESHPKELVYAWHMTRWLERLAPNASEPIRLAARCQHICRWEIPRDSYPLSRAGYRQWRTALANFHADKAGGILRDVGYDDETIARVRSLLRKENLEDDPETQLLEDVICVVFLENYFTDFANEHDADKVVSIVRKTWKKMSPRGHETALQLPLSNTTRALLAKALEQ